MRRYDLQIREITFTDPFGGLRSGHLDLVYVWSPIHETDLAVGATPTTSRWLDFLPARTPSGRPIPRGPAIRDTVVEWIADVAAGRAVSGAHAPAERHHN